MNKSTQPRRKSAAKSSKRPLHSKPRIKNQREISSRSSSFRPSSRSLSDEVPKINFNGKDIYYVATGAPVPSYDPQDGTINTDPGYLTSSRWPGFKVVPPPQLRKWVHEVDESKTPAKRAPISPEQFTTGYRFLLRHLKFVTDPRRHGYFKKVFRDDFELLRKREDYHSAAVQFDSTIPPLWSQLAVVRMNISKIRRPKIPESLAGLATYLGALQEGPGFYCAVPSNDDRFNTIHTSSTDAPPRAAIVESRGAEFAQKAKLYNMDLHPADIERHYELVERYHFNGKERAHRGGGW